MKIKDAKPGEATRIEPGTELRAKASAMNDSDAGELPARGNGLADPAPAISTRGVSRVASHRRMLKDLNPEQARFIALLAGAARIKRDEQLGIVAERDLAEVKPARGEHNPTASLGLEPLADSSPQFRALRDAIAGLSPEARSELYALMRVGQGDLAVRKWYRGIGEAALLGDETIIASLIEDPDLHDHLAKGLYEARLASTEDSRRQLLAGRRKP